MPKDIITKGDIVDVLIFNKVPFDNKPFALIPKKMKLGIGLTKDVQNVLNVKLNSDIAKLLRGHNQGDKIKSPDSSCLIQVESITHHENVK